MLTFKIVRKIGKMLRGGAGKKEIFLGALCGVLIGFNPVAGLTLALAILVTLLLNANVGFTLLGVLVGKVLCLALSVVSFHTGYFIIHSLGLEGLFTTLANAPVTALMNLDVYAMVGSLPYAIIIGIAFGKFMDTTVTKIREQMVRAGEHDKVGKVAGNKFSKLLMWLVFGKQKISTADVLAKESPLLRKSGLILVGSVLIIGLLLEFLLLDIAVKKGIQSAIAANTGAEVNIEKAHLSLAGGKLEIENLQITDPDKPSHNLVQLKTLAADISVGDLLRQTYTIDHLAGATLKRNTLRDKPGAVYAKAGKKRDKAKEAAKEGQPGKSLEDYFAKAQTWKNHGGKAYEYLKKRKANAEAIQKGEKPKATKEAAVADAKKLGYLKAAADLVADRPAWTIHRISIQDIQLGDGRPPQIIMGSELSSHPELNGQPTTLAMTPVGGSKPSAKIVLHFDDPAAQHEFAVNLTGIALGDTLETSDSFPVNISDGKVDIKANGTFSADELALPFTLLVRNLKADVEDGQTIMGMDAKTATEVLSSMGKLEIDGSLGGSLLSPRVNIDYDKLTASMKQALVAAGKKELSKRANKEIDKAKDEAKKQAGEELDKLLGGEEGDSTEDKAKGLLKKLF
ncbi:MAG: DUF2062 domain-containing protein [Verrucomicrobia bacterium]|nr:DUF2062 domain-containing protein [Verrucomicrobiota bacterium]